MSTAVAETGEMARLEIRKGVDGRLAVGGLELVACRREVGEIDGGITLYVWSALPDEARELLRIDLFRNRPHYHAPAENEAETRIPPEDPVAWGIDAITGRAPELLRQGGFDGVAERVDLAALAAAGPAMRGLFDGLAEPTEVSYFEVPRAVLEGLATS